MWLMSNCPSMNYLREQLDRVCKITMRSRRWLLMQSNWKCATTKHAMCSIQQAWHGCARVVSCGRGTHWSCGAQQCATWHAGFTSVCVCVLTTWLACLGRSCGSSRWSTVVFTAMTATTTTTITTITTNTNCQMSNCPDMIFYVSNWIGFAKLPV